MWTFGELKERAKIAIRANYWNCVLVSFIYLVVSGGLLYGGVSKTYSKTFDSQFGKLMTQENIIRFFYGLIFASIMTMVLFLIVTFFALLFKSFVTDTFQIGASGFYISNRIGSGDTKDVLSGFASEYYLKNVRINFEKNLTITLWSFVFVIPGVIKALELSMVPYILAEQPHLSKDEVFQLSRDMTDGNKMKILLFQLSFFLWFLLASVTFGVVHVFWVAPYVDASNAELYKQLAGEYNRNYA